MLGQHALASRIFVILRNSFGLKEIPRLIHVRWVQHILFWIGHIVFYGLLYGSFEEKYAQSFLQELLYLPGKVVFTYFVLYYLLPKYVLPGLYGQFTIWLLVSSLVVGVFQRYIAYTVDYPLHFPQFLGDPFFYWPKIIKQVVMIYPITFFAVAIKLLKYWYAHQQATQVLHQEKLQAELKFLKTQIHPHFLFNTLNNLYALTLKKSDRAPEMVLKLSELINYMLYECVGDEVDLAKEVKFIRNYIDIEKMRYGDLLDVDVTIRGDLAYRRIAPLILLPFVENSFKHGASEDVAPAWVKLSLDVQPDLLIIKVENSKSEPEIVRTPGIGIQNVRRRLDLLYPRRHDLKIINGQETFLVVLTIQA